MLFGAFAERTLEVRKLHDRDEGLLSAARGHAPATGTFQTVRSGGGAGSSFTGSGCLFKSRSTSVAKTRSAGVPERTSSVAFASSASSVCRKVALGLGPGDLHAVREEVGRTQSSQFLRELHVALDGVRDRRGIRFRLHAPRVEPERARTPRDVPDRAPVVPRSSAAGKSSAASRSAEIVHRLARSGPHRSA